MDIREKVKKIPAVAGVYIMKSKRGEVLYVGKASSLKKRINSYFSNRGSVKIDNLLEKVANIDYIECNSPEQALILEAALIKEKKPKYNIALRDNKSYPYLEITREKFPRLTISRPRVKTKNILIGPYPRVKVLKDALSLIRKIFPYRSCKTMSKNACLFFHLKLCPAPCIKKISSRSYKNNVESICKILRGERKKLVNGLKNKMNKLAAKRNFEEAAKIRDKLLAIEGLYEGKPKEHELISLKEMLGLPALPLVIEAIDISSLGSSNSVGSLVTFKDGIPDKNNYRRFLIREIKSRDDYAMIAEVVRRRYSRLIREKKALPDLTIIDGGKAHAQRARKELDSLGLKIPIIGIAKRNEEIWFPHKEKPLIIPKDSPCLHLIQRVRDEAHRFAHAYQLIRRRKTLIGENK